MAILEDEVAERAEAAENVYTVVTDDGEATARNVPYWHAALIAKPHNWKVWPGDHDHRPGGWPRPVELASGSARAARPLSSSLLRSTGGLPRKPRQQVRNVALNYGAKGDCEDGQSQARPKRYRVHTSIAGRTFT